MALAQGLEKALIENGYTIPAPQQAQLVAYLNLLSRWNRVFNLTRIETEDGMIFSHILDSLAITPYLIGKQLLDVGSGAGLPGIPLAITQPERSFTLLDSNSKKTRFLTQVVAELQLPNVTVVHSRVEDFHPPQLFDSIMSRAFASLQVMLTQTEHLLAEHGQFLAMKGRYPEQEMQALTGAVKLKAVHKLTIKGLAAERHLICLGKG